METRSDLLPGVGSSTAPPGAAGGTEVLGHGAEIAHEQRGQVAA
jgi:hypothetical protein